MRNLYVLLLVLVLVIPSCDFLEVVPENTPNYEDVFKNRNEAERALHGLYTYIPDYSTYRNVVAGITDEFSMPPGWGEVWFPQKPTWQGAFSASSMGFNFWSNTNNSGFNVYANYNLYEGMRYGHSFINRIDKVPDLDDTERKQWKAEANFLIGYYHYLLFRAYGPIVLVDKEVPFDAPEEEYYPKRASIDESVDFIVDYLDRAIPDLPQQYDARLQGKPTSVAAKSLKAKVLVYAASPLFNGESPSMIKGLTGPDGETLFPQSADPSKWQRALRATTAAINAAHDAGHSLYEEQDLPDLSEAWSGAKDAVARNRYKIVDKWNDELIWGYSNPTGVAGNNWQYQGLRTSKAPNRPLNAVEVTIEAVERFYTGNGLPIDVDPAYDYENRYTVKAGDSTAYLNRNRDPRFYATVGHDRGIYRVNGTRFVIRHRAGEEHGLFPGGVNSSGPTGYVIKKFTHPETYIDNVTVSFETYPHPIIRLADLYLLHAEAYNEVNGGLSGDALNYFNRVRQRAGIPTLQQSWSAVGGVPSSKEGMREIIKAERYNEFAIENQWFFDIRRWLDAAKYLNRPVHGWSVTESLESGFYQLQSNYENLTRRFDIRFYLLPIPQAEININNNLVQNPGW